MSDKTFKEMGIDSFPLSWPTGWKRTKYRRSSQFKTTFAKARDQLFKELRLLGCQNWNVVLSSNIPLRRDGLPYANQANPGDSGFAIYFKFKGKNMVFACDQYISVTDNLYAITKTIEALRGITRWGASDMMERSFTGFAALPPAKSNWWEILGVSKDASATEIGQARRRLAEEHHPDKGGSVDMMTKINNAFEEGMNQC